MKKALVILDDRGNDIFTPAKFEKCLAEQSVNCEVIVASRTGAAINSIRALAVKGISSYVLTCDLDTATDPTGSRGARDLTQVLGKIRTELGDQYLPEKVFFHSSTGKDPDAVGPDFKAPFDPRKWNALWGETVEVLHTGDLHGLTQRKFVPSFIHTPEFRAFLNRAWGTSYDLSLKQTLARTATRESEKISPAEILGQLNLEHFEITGYRRAIVPESDPPFAIRLRDGTSGKTAVGPVAFSLKDAQEFLDKNPKAQITLFLEEATDSPVPPNGIEAISVLKNNARAMHMAEICRTIQKTSGIGLHPDFEYRRDEEGNYIFTDNSRPDHPSFTLKKGQIVTMERTGNGTTMHLAGLPLQQPRNEHLENLGPVVAEAQKILQRVRLNPEDYAIKGIAFNGNGVRQMKEAGATEIGLCRTEHQFTTSAHGREILRNVLLQETPNSGILREFYTFQKEAMGEFLSAAKEEALPVTIRLMNTPLPEILTEHEINMLQERYGVSADDLCGVQGGLQIPELYLTQMMALDSAIIGTRFNQPINLLIPNVRHRTELEAVSKLYNIYLNRETLLGWPDIKLAAMIENQEAVNMVYQNSQDFPFVCFGMNDFQSSVTLDDDGNPIRRNDTEKIIEWMNRNNVGGQNPFVVLPGRTAKIVSSMMADVNAARAESGQLPIGVTACGRQFANYDSLRLAFDNSISVSTTNPAYVLLVWAQYALELEKRAEPALNAPADPGAGSFSDCINGAFTSATNSTLKAIDKEAIRAKIAQAQKALERPMATEQELFKIEYPEALPYDAEIY